MRLLALDAALGPCSAAVLQDGRCVAAHQNDDPRGAVAALPVMIEALLADGRVDAVCVTVGPGSFTGLRAALALAHGVALGAGIPLVGVTAAEAVAEAVPSHPGRTLWVALDTRRHRVFLDRAGTLAAMSLDALPQPDSPVLVAGDAAGLVAVALCQAGFDAVASAVRGIKAADAGRVALRRLAGGLPPCEPQPLYVEPPEARATAPLRPAPLSPVPCPA
jgi:tRNA threonylcarbamoyladenosine biosynthesis protein TsaB